MINYYDAISTGYEELHKQEQENKIKIIKENLPFKIKPDYKLLDVGCGTGITTLCWDCKIYGLDPSIKLLEKAKSKNIKNVNWIHAPAENIPFKDNEFDIVTSITAIQNFDNLEKGLDEIKRVGKNKFILTFLKASLRKDIIDKTIKNKFKISKIIEEDKDLIYLIDKQ